MKSAPKHTSLIINELMKNITSEEQAQTDEKMLISANALEKPLHDLDISVRLYHLLKITDSIKTLNDIYNTPLSKLMEIKGFGKKSLAELEQLFLENHIDSPFEKN